MALLKYGTRIRVLTTTPGTGAYAVGNSPAGYLDPIAGGMVSGDRSTWCCESEDGATWELFEGVLTTGSPSTISRARIIRNSNGGTSAIAWTTGTRRITQVISGDRTAFLDSNGKLAPDVQPVLITQLSRPVAYSLPSSTGEYFPFTQILADTMGGAGIADRQIVLQAAGLYSVVLVMRCDGSLTGTTRRFSISVNDIDRAGQYADPTAIQNLVSVSFLAQLSAGDRIKAAIYHDATGALGFGGFGLSTLTAVRLA